MEWQNLFWGEEKKKIVKRKSEIANKFYFCNENKKTRICVQQRT